MDSCFVLVGYRQHGVASNEVISWSTDHPCPLNADDDDLKWNSNPNFCRFANVTKRLTKDNRKNPEYHVIAVIRKLWADKNCFHWGYVHKVHLILYLMNLHSYSHKCFCQGCKQINHKNYNYLLLFFTNSLAKLLSDSLLSDSSISQSHSKL